MKSSKESRRNFIKKSVLGVGAISVLGNNTNCAADKTSGTQKKKLPREVWIATISQEKLHAENSTQMISKILGLMEEIAPLKPDIICTPEIFPFVGISKKMSVEDAAEEGIGKTIKPFSDFAKKNRCYIICSTYTKEAGKYYNAAVLLDRDGKRVGEYRKMFPTIGECDSNLCPGSTDPPVFQTDFGKIGMQICYDINWVDGWNTLKRKGAEIVFWPSAYGGGAKLNSYANLFNYHVVSSTRKNISKIIDVTGENIATTGSWERNWICTSVNLEKEIINVWPSSKYYKRILGKYGRDVKITTLHDDGISILESLSVNLKVADILKEFKIKTVKENMLSAENAQKKI
ncbi:MAG: carbon-nitrogen hydrolase family protein [Melioribacteraceae bacterium]